MRKNKKKLIVTNIIILCISVLFFIYLFVFFTSTDDKKVYMIDLTDYNIEQIKEFTKDNELHLELKYEYNDNIGKDKIINQSIKENKLLNINDKLIVIVSLGGIPTTLYKEYNVNELGVVPIMMYHGIHHLKNSDTIYTGGNVDKDGYNRTTEAFINDLEMYYQKGYRMIRLQDYVNGNIKVELGKSPIILTFDDGAINNIKILGKDDTGNLIIDPNSAVGILEQFKIKYPDYNVTATFFLNKLLFNQPKYNNDILKWLIDNDYDIGNHTSNHYRLSDISANDTAKEIATMYQIFDQIIPNKYVKIVALPFGLPDKKSHKNFPYILDGTYNNYKYNTITTLRVGWEAELSPYDINFDKTYLKRVRAWDNDGKDDIEMHFKRLERTKYVSSGNDEFIVIPKPKENKINSNLNKQVIMYE